MSPCCPTRFRAGGSVRQYIIGTIHDVFPFFSNRDAWVIRLMVWRVVGSGFT